MITTVIKFHVSGCQALAGLNLRNCRGQNAAVSVQGSGLRRQGVGGEVAVKLDLRSGWHHCS